MATAWSPDEQKRLTVVPATDTGSPARTSATRATLLPWAPLGWAQPRITSSISDGSSCGTLPSTSRMQWAAKSSGRVRLNDPRKDLASGVRELATTTASLMASPFLGTLTRSIPDARGSVPTRPASSLAELWRGAAVDDDGRPRHERRGVGRQEDARVRDLVHLAPAAHAHAIGHGVVRLLGRRGILLGQHVHVAFGLHRARGDAVDADVLPPPGHAERAREVDHGRLGGAVVRHHARAVDARDGRHVDDEAAALGHHLPARPLAAEKDAVEVDPDHGVPAIGADVLGFGAERGSGIVDHDVQPPQLLHRALNEPLDRLFLAHVHRHAEGAAPELLDLRRDRLEVLDLAAADDDGRAGLGEFQRERAAYVDAAARDDGDLLLQ